MQLRPIGDVLQLIARNAEFLELTGYDFHSIPIADRSVHRELRKCPCMQVRAASIDDIAERLWNGNKDLNWPQILLRLSALPARVFSVQPRRVREAVFARS